MLEFIYEILKGVYMALPLKYIMPVFISVLVLMYLFLWK